MKSRLPIGQFAKSTGVTARALRLYESRGLIPSATRGENGYRYYDSGQIARVRRIRDLKELGFTLREIKACLDADESMDFDKLRRFLRLRLRSLDQQSEILKSRRSQIHSALSSLPSVDRGLDPEERRFIMSQFENIRIVVTGVRALEATAETIRSTLSREGLDLPVLNWSDDSDPRERRPAIVILPEARLESEGVTALRPDVVVIKDLGSGDPDLKRSYLRLYTSAGPDMTTVFNADDRASVELAGQEKIRQGRIYYYSKNSALEDQIKRIGGVMSDGEEIRVFGLNRIQGPHWIKLDRILSLDEETALLATLAAVIDAGLRHGSEKEPE